MGLVIAPLRSPASKVRLTPYCHARPPPMPASEISTICEFAGCNSHAPRDPSPPGHGPREDRPHSLITRRRRLALR
jgi:hypothetical protein